MAKDEVYNTFEELKDILEDIHEVYHERIDSKEVELIIS